jgi:hypothetical protein
MDYLCKGHMLADVLVAAVGAAAAARSTSCSVSRRSFCARCTNRIDIRGSLPGAGQAMGDMLAIR